MKKRVTTAALIKGAITRSQNAASTNKNDGQGSEVPKRKAESSPTNDKTLKRSAFADITNVSSSLSYMNSYVFHKFIPSFEKII
jgi:hypothetical protein